MARHHSVPRVEQTNALETDQRLGSEDDSQQNDQQTGTEEEASVHRTPRGDEGVDGAHGNENCSSYSAG